MYETHFGLSDLPFQISPDARFYVDATPHRAALNALLAGVRRGDEFMLLTGDFGTGKTTVARRLLEEIDRERYAVADLPGLRLEGDDVFDRIADAFGMRGLEAHHRLATMIRMLEDIAQAGRQALLVIDEAHSIGLDSLRRLRKLTGVRAEGRGVLHVCLVGRAAPPGIDDLARIGRPLAVGTTFHLEALDGPDTRGYVLHRLRQVGWSGRPGFDKDVTAEIHACCEGNPARINRLCAHILLQLYMQGRDDTSAGIVRAVDTMMRSELEGEPAVVDLPPAPRAGPREPDTILESFSRPPVEEEESSVDIEALMTRPLSPNLPAVRRTEPEMALAPWRPGGASEDVAAGAPVRRLRWLQAGVAMALFVGGGFTWHALSGRLATPLGAMGVATAAHAGPATVIGQAAPTALAGHVAPSALVAALPATADGASPAPQPGTAGDAATQLATAPPAAGHAAPGEAAAAPPPVDVHAPATDAPPAATPLRLAETPRGAAAGERNRHRPRARGTEERPPVEARAATELAEPAAFQAPAALAGTCTAAAETLSLCTHAAPRAPAGAAPREPAAPEASARDAARESPPPEAAPRPAPLQRPCDRTQAVLGLCGGSWAKASHRTPACPRAPHQPKRRSACAASADSSRRPFHAAGSSGDPSARRCSWRPPSPRC